MKFEKKKNCLSYVSFVLLALLVMVSFAVSKELKTVITGDQMEIIQSGKTVIFTGNSRVTRGKSVLSADKLIQYKGKDRIEAIGAVGFSTLTKENESVTGKAGMAFYSPGSGKGELFDSRPEIIYRSQSSSETVILHADKIQFNEKNREMHAQGDVKVFTSSATAFSPNIFFDQKEKKVVLTAESNVRPILVFVQEKQRGRYSAENILMLVEEKKVFLAGNVNGKINIDEPDKD